jgi:hypothetical protein
MGCYILFQAVCQETVPVLKLELEPAIHGSLVVGQSKKPPLCNQGGWVSFVDRGMLILRAARFHPLKT